MMMNVNAIKQAVPDDAYIEPIAMDLSIAQILLTRHPKGFRRPFVENPYLAQITLRKVLSSPFALSDFVVNCRRLPHCGEVTITRLLAVIERAMESQIDKGIDIR